MSTIDSERSFHEDYQFVQEFSASTAERLTTRLLSEKDRIDTKKTPVGGIYGVQDVKMFGYNARMGFKLGFRADREGIGVDFEKLYRATDKFEAAALIDEIDAILNPNSVEIETPAKNVYLPLFGQLVASLIFLKRQGNVSLASLDHSSAFELGHWAGVHTHWNTPLSSENIWGIIDELDASLHSAVFGKGRIYGRELDELMRTSHFFAASSLIAKEYLGKM